MRPIALWLATAAIIAVTAAAAEEGSKERDSTAETPSIPVFLDEKTAGKGLLLTIEGPVEVRPDQLTKVTYWITNFLEEEVFVEVRDVERLAYDHRYPDGGLISAGGGFPSFPDNLALLKRLHASHYRKGQRITCGCAAVRVDATAALSKEVTAEGKTTASIVVRGFYRKDGREFHQSIDVPLAIQTGSAK